VVERELVGKLVDGMPGGVGRKLGVESPRHEAEIRRGELPLVRVAVRVAHGLQLLEPGQLRHVDLSRELGPNRLLEGMAGL
jgi:hypothetical protein